MSAVRAIGWVLLLTLTTALIVGGAFALFYVLAPIDEYRSLSTAQLAYMGTEIGMPLGALLGAIASTCGVLSEKRPALDYVLAGAVGGLFAANSAVLLFALGGPAANGFIALTGTVVGALIGTFRNKFWPDKAVHG